jgi:hypothetical protein
MTKKHFEAFAKRIYMLTADPEQIPMARYFADVVIDIAAWDNPRFDRARFLKACGLGD